MLSTIRILVVDSVMKKFVSPAGRMPCMFSSLSIACYYKSGLTELGSWKQGRRIQNDRERIIYCLCMSIEVVPRTFSKNKLFSNLF